MTAEGLRLSSARGRGTLFATVLGSGMGFLDATVVNVALPAVGRDLNAGMAGLQWTMDAYLLTLGTLLLVGGALGDRYGRRRLFIVGLVCFALASALCGLASSMAMMMTTRAAQGVGAALLTPGSLALLRASFREEEQGQAVGAWAGLSGVSTALGPVLGGWLVDAVSWRLIFFINLPLAALAVWAARRWVPESRDPLAAPRLDLAGAVLAALGLGGVLYALIEAGSLGWSAHAVLAAGLTGAALLVLFLVVEQRSHAPMLPLALFRSRQFAGANGATFAVYFALGGAFFLLVLQLQQSLGYSALKAGASLLPITALMLVLSPLAGRWADRSGFRLPMTLGPLIAAIGLGLLTRVAPGHSYPGAVLPGVVVFGLGLSCTVAPLTAAVLSAAEARHAGVASAVNNAIARIASLLGVAVLPLVSGLGGLQALSAATLTRGFVQSMWISAGICALGGVVAAFTVSGARSR